MAKSVNKVILIGNLGKDPEIKYTPSGTAVAKFSLATNERFKDKSGEWQDRTEWHNIVAWQRLAEIVGEYVKKGNKLYIEGRLQTSSWDDKESGQKKYKTEIIANDLVLLSGRGEGDEASGGGRSFSRGAASLMRWSGSLRSRPGSREPFERGHCDSAKHQFRLRRFRHARTSAWTSRALHDSLPLAGDRRLACADGDRRCRRRQAVDPLVPEHRHPRQTSLRDGAADTQGFRRRCSYAERRRLPLER